MNHLTKTKYSLVEREKLGPNAYRVSAVHPGTDFDGNPFTAETGFEQVRKEIKRYPKRYNAVSGTHTLVLLAVPQ